MKIVVAPDSFKGSLDAQKICDIVEKVAFEVFPNSQVVKIPMADGGEGTVDSVLKNLNGEKVEVKVLNPIGVEITASYGVFGEDNAIIEMAQASGLPLLKENERNIKESNTYGTGQLILDAINRGCKNIYIGIGGSATNDGGIGCVSAFGVKFLDCNNMELKPLPINFNKICNIDTSQMDKRIKDINFTVMCDVKNSLLGENGASKIFGKQKGATQEDIVFLDEGLKNYIEVVEKKVNKKVCDIEGAGAAGGLGAGLLAFTNAVQQSGIDTVIKIVDFDTKVKGADLVVTGEGRMDNQSALGKVAYGVGLSSKNANIPCVAIVGSLGDNYDNMYDYGINSIMTTVDKPMKLEEAISNAEQLCYSAVKRAFKFMQII